MILLSKVVFAQGFNVRQNSLAYPLFHRPRKVFGNRLLSWAAVQNCRPILPRILLCFFRRGNVVLVKHSDEFLVRHNPWVINYSHCFRVILNATVRRVLFLASRVPNTGLSDSVHSGESEFRPPKSSETKKSSLTFIGIWYIWNQWANCLTRRFAHVLRLPICLRRAGKSAHDTFQPVRLSNLHLEAAEAAQLSL